MSGSDVDIFLEHYGVKGMHWGIRNEKVTISEKPWSAYSKADYSVPQWHNACLIHNHKGAPTAKNQCKLPVRTPDGTLNRHGVYSAAAVLDGARGGVMATTEQKKQAAKQVAHFYKQMNQTPPPSLLLKQSALEAFLEHYGIKGMKWGVRNEKPRLSSDYKKVSELRKKPVKSLTNHQLKIANERLNLETSFHRLNPKFHITGKRFAKDLIETVGVATSLVALAEKGPEIINAGRSFAWKMSYLVVPKIKSL